MPSVIASSNQPRLGRDMLACVLAPRRRRPEVGTPSALRARSNRCARSVSSSRRDSMTGTAQETAYVAVETPTDLGPRAGLSATILSAVVLITSIAPLATDTYVPAFPLVARDLDATAMQVQLTLTTFFVGMALG